jgi:hypothetical protein
MRPGLIFTSEPSDQKTPAFALVFCVLVTACNSPERPAAVAVSSTADWFSDQAQAVGLDFVHVNGMTGQYYLAEIMAPGVGIFDFDNDGDLDVYAVQSQLLKKGEPASAQDRLYRNDLHVGSDGSRTIRFTDVTARAGLIRRSYGMGIATGDIDNDGWTDLYLTRLGADALLKNNRDGTFTDIFAMAGLTDPGWTVAASFLDFDRDGWLDLFVSTYLRYSIETESTCVGPTGARDYCNPQNYPALPGRLFRNARNGTFQDVTVTSGVTKEYGPALGTLAFDANNDGWLDLYVANDGSENQLWLNQRDGTFSNAALLAGVAVNGDGRPEGSMGVDAADFDNDGDEDVVITNLGGEGSTLYANQGEGIFRDVAAATGVRSRSLPLTGFGTAWIDADNDGWLDLLTVNGAIQTIQTLADSGDRFPLHQRKQLLRNLGNGRFEDVTMTAGSVFALSEVGRGASFGDVDNDGDVDVVVANNNGRMRLLLNERGNRRRWLGIRAVSGEGRDALGALVGIVSNDGVTRWLRVRTDGSYASASDPRVLFGLGESQDIVRIRIRWPNGRAEDWPNTATNQWLTLRERVTVQ